MMYTLYGGNGGTDDPGRRNDREFSKVSDDRLETEVLWTLRT